MWWREGYRKRLERDSRAWVAQGWLAAEGREQIIGSLGAAGGHRYTTTAFILLGVLLLGTGVISFFAANWQAMPKLLKLTVLFGSLWTSYLLAYFFGRNDAHRALHHGLLLLGVILFGANIMLVAQIYHIDHHYPDGVMWWAIGGLLTAVLMRSQPSMVAALALAILWGGMEQFDFERAIFWPMLVFIAAALPSILRHNWQFALKVAMIGLLLWSLFSYWVNPLSGGAHVYLGQIYFLLYVALYLLAGMFESYRGDDPTNAEQMGIVRSFAVFAVLGCFYLQTFPSLLEDVKSSAASALQWASWAAALLLLALGWWRYRQLQQRGGTLPGFVQTGLLLLGAMITLVLLNLYLVHDIPGAMALLANLVYFATLLWLIFAGVHLRLRSLVNLAFFFFALTLLTRYFDTFWSLMDRSLFFMGGGLILIVGGALLERQRRRLTAAISKQHEGGES